MNYSIAKESRIGGREINQDRVAWQSTDEALLMVVADGMGGHLQGEVAAQIAIDTVGECFRGAAKPRLADPARFLADSLRKAHEIIVRYATECRIPPPAAPRTTCVACVVQDAQATWAHAGDSRLYLVRADEREAAAGTRTRDHSVVQRMVDTGTLRHEQAAGHPLRNRVFNCLGGDGMPHVEVSATVPLQDGDLIALCTDGAWSPLGESLTTELGRAPLTIAVPHLLDAAERAAGVGADNLTLIAMRWEAAKPSFDDTYVGESPLTDAEIEKAIAAMRHRPPPTPHGSSS